MIVFYYFSFRMVLILFIRNHLYWCSVLLCLVRGRRVPSSNAQGIMECLRFNLGLPYATPAFGLALQPQQGLGWSFPFDSKPGHKEKDDQSLTCFLVSDALVAMEKAMKRDKIIVNDRQLACARISSPEGQDYLKGMAAAGNYAWVNRSSMTFLTRQVLCQLLFSPELFL